ncbi:DUF4260 domain-containing protein [Celeribacter litoreus]|uniref:DUF4260 domain-containing protein n=1 Tax=Celeribacter litoreus TaxID=2876714 RepID=UPI001CCF0DE9|nr:DUF4260 domain-containing protein [Celeribacter litoreus]MCA0044085.1 DUF4260 domain-containing protein [Celeribacter litoreus]
MIIWQRIEGGLVCLSALLILTQVGIYIPIWMAVLLFFAPDLAFFGYLFGPRVGAVAYNALHIYAFGLILAAIGVVFGGPVWIRLGLLWIAHAGFDRALGYGLKSAEAFGITHLGRIGPKSD